MIWSGPSEATGVALPDGWSAVALSPAQQGDAILRVCVLVHPEADAVTGHFRVLRTTFDTQVFLGCVCDRESRVLGWVELWVQSPQADAASLIGAHKSLSDASAADRWPRTVQAIGECAPGSLIWTGWERAKVPPTEIDLSTLEPKGKFNGKISFNASGGPILVRRHLPMRLERYLDVLTAGKSAGHDDAIGEGWMFLGRHGRAGRLTETLHLKLRVIADAIDSVSSMAKATRRPMLDLSAESFRVDLSAPAPGLPKLWTAPPALVEPGAAIEMTLADGGQRFFLPGQKPVASIYAPAQVQAARGRASVRLRDVTADKGGTTIVSGTFVTHERLNPSPRDLVWFRLPLGGTSVDVYARLEREPALAPGEWRLRSIPHKFEPQIVEQLKAAAGVPFADVPFEHLPMLSSPCDLYALGVLMVRALLVNAHAALPMALDDLFSLAKHLAATVKNADQLPAAIADAFAKEKRWQESLGPQRLFDEPLSASEAIDLIPPSLWFDVLAAILRTFPGIGPYARVRDFGDAPPEGLHAVFDRVCADVASLLVRSRSLIVIDWRYNREVHSVIRQYATGVAAKTDLADSPTIAPPVVAPAPSSSSAPPARAGAPAGRVAPPPPPAPSTPAAQSQQQSSPGAAPPAAGAPPARRAGAAARP